MFFLGRLILWSNALSQTFQIGHLTVTGNFVIECLPNKLVFMGTTWYYLIYAKEVLSGAQINPFVLIESSFWFNTSNLGWSIVYIDRSQVIP